MSPAFHTSQTPFGKDPSNSLASLERIVNQLDLSPDRNRTHLAGNTGMPITNFIITKWRGL
jgi:hypothetical protein